MTLHKTFPWDGLIVDKLRSLGPWFPFLDILMDDNEGWTIVKAFRRQQENCNQRESLLWNYFSFPTNSHDSFFSWTHFSHRIKWDSPKMENKNLTNVLFYFGNTVAGVQIENIRFKSRCSQENFSNFISVANDPILIKPAISETAGWLDDDGFCGKWTSKWNFLINWIPQREELNLLSEKWGEKRKIRRSGKTKIAQENQNNFT